MKTINKTKPVLVTGGTGYLASWVVKQLLDEGLQVEQLSETNQMLRNINIYLILHQKVQAHLKFLMQI